MNSSIFDVITGAFVGAIESGIGALQQYSLPLLAAFALIAFYTQTGPLVMSGMQLGDAVGTVLLTVLKTGVFSWVLINLVPITTAAFLTFIQWGVAPTGGGMTPGTFLQPSTVIDVGFRAAAPLQEFIAKLTGWATLWNFFTVFIYTMSYWGIVLSFAFVALHLMLTIIEFHLAVLAGVVLIPWGVLGATAFFAEFAIGWLTGGLIRVLLTSAIFAIAVPLFDLLTFATTPGGDPTLYSAIVVGAASIVFAILNWVIPARAATIAGRGLALGLTGGTVVAGVAGGAGLMTRTIRGTSALLSRRRAE
jgi:type IV secretion system protein TrbL